MKKLILLFCTFTFLVTATSCFNAKADARDVKLITADEMNAILALEDVQVVDVRSPKEFEASHIANAQNIDFRSPTFEVDINKLDKTKPVILYCKSGGRSAKCAKQLKDAGFEKVYDLEGGISKWKHSDKLIIEEKS